MEGFLRRQRLSFALAPAAGLALGVLTAATFLLLPLDRLEGLVLASGIPAVIAAAEPPLGFTARLAIALFSGVFLGGVLWFALFLAFGGRTLAFGPEEELVDPTIPVLRRADAHPDAPPRAPLLATRELGTPFLEVRAKAAEVAPPPVERPLPADLDMPLSAYDPGAFASVRPFGPGERIATFDLPVPTPSVPAPARDPAPRDTEATISALLERLERGVVDRQQRADRFDATLTTLRKLAPRG
ncbi:MAG: hypothetical protein A4S16_00995 [Proteobacteria bacterium SG_bin6]|nr:MAG: hypothetical protein A4S16_00995 [Proteobacteria bacterium SG_bin6]